jgi:hypothetical protein
MIESGKDQTDLVSSTQLNLTCTDDDHLQYSMLAKQILKDLFTTMPAGL